MTHTIYLVKCVGSCFPQNEDWAQDTIYVSPQNCSMVCESKHRLESGISGNSGAFSSDVVLVEFYRCVSFHIPAEKRGSWEMISLCFHYKIPLEKWIWWSTVVGAAHGCWNSIVPTATLNWLIALWEVANLFCSASRLMGRKSAMRSPQHHFFPFFFFLVRIALLSTRFIKVFSGTWVQLHWPKPWMRYK